MSTKSDKTPDSHQISEPHTQKKRFRFLQRVKESQKVIYLENEQQKRVGTGFSGAGVYQDTLTRSCGLCAEVLISHQGLQI